MDRLEFSESPIVELATNRFVNVPIVLQYESTPLIEVVKQVDVGYQIEVPIFHPDGTYLAKVKGSRLFLTEDGRKAGLTIRNPDKMTVCELDGRTLFEIHRYDAAAIKAAAELYTNDGSFIKCNDQGLAGKLLGDRKDAIELGGITMIGNTISGFRVGIHIFAAGGVAIGASGKLPDRPENN